MNLKKLNESLKDLKSSLTEGVDKEFLKEKIAFLKKAGLSPLGKDAFITGHNLGAGLAIPLKDNYIYKNHMKALMGDKEFGSLKPSTGSLLAVFVKK